MQLMPTLEDDFIIKFLWRIHLIKLPLTDYESYTT